MHAEVRTIKARLLALGLSACILGGCGDSEQPSPTSGKCIAQVRIDDVIYDAVGRVETTVPAEKLGVAEVASCADVGESASGPYFPTDKQLSPSWTFDGHPSASVIGIREDGSMSVYVVETMSDEDQQRILAELKSTASE